MKSFLIALIILFSTINISFAAPTCADGNCTAEDCQNTATHPHVQDCVDGTSAGGTCTVPAGTCTWSSPVRIGHAITLLGSGNTSSGTVITSGLYTAGYNQATPLVRIKIPLAEVATLARISNFRFNGYDTAAAKWLPIAYFYGPYTYSSTTGAFTQTGIGMVRFDGNHVTGRRGPYLSSCYGDNECDTMPLVFYFFLKGVIDSNDFYFGDSVGDNIYVARDKALEVTWTKTSGDYSTWNNGTIDNIFVEDNSFYKTNGAQNVIAGRAGSIVVRYNDFDYTGTTTYLYAMDTHGRQAGQYYGAFGGEIYGNRIKGATEAYGYSVCNFRGGKGKIFYNRYDGAEDGTVKVATLYGDDYHFGGVGGSVVLNTCASSHLYYDRQTKLCASDQRSMYPTTYTWNNRYGAVGASGTLMVHQFLAGASLNPPSVYLARRLRENTDVFFDYANWTPTGTDNGTDNPYEKLYTFSSAASFTGAVATRAIGAGAGAAGAIGCGTLANRPATCTTGAAYWAGVQRAGTPCSDIPSGSYGRNPSSPITGTLYICSATNTWGTTYTPYEYPHPYRNTSDTTSPSVSTPSPSGQQACTAPSEDVAISVLASDSVGVTGCKACLENGSTCTTATAYGDMDVTLSLSSGTANLGTWGTTVTSACDSSIAYNVKCTDATSNISSNVVIGYEMEADEDTTDPTLDSYSLGVNGRTLTLTFSEPIKNGGSYADTDWTFTDDAASVGITCTIQEGSATVTCQTAACVAAESVLTLDFEQPVAEDSLQDLAGNALADINPVKSVTNNSTQACGSATSLFYPDVLTYTTNTDTASNLGVRFQSSTAGTLTHVCYYKDATLTGTHTATVWNDSCTLLATKVIGSDTGTGWKCQTLDSAVDILADTNYRIAVHFPTSAYIKVSSFFANAYTENNLSVASGGGRYLDSANPGCPSSTTQSNFLVDFIMAYQTASGPWQVTTSKTGTGCASISDSSLVADEGTAEITVTLLNGWQVSMGGTCGGSGSLSGNTYTYTTSSVTADCTVVATCTAKNIVPWIAP